MSLRRGQRRALRGIERDLARSDPNLDSLFFSFGGLARTQEIPAAEKIGTRQFRLLARLGQESRQRGGADWRVWPRPYF